MFCLFHNYEVIATSTDFFTTRYDLNNLKQYHFISFKQCTKCGKRKLDFGKDSVESKKRHGGILRAQILWEQEGALTEAASPIRKDSVVSLKAVE